jgi:hypothetical protein
MPCSCVAESVGRAGCARVSGHMVGRMACQGGVAQAAQWVEGAEGEEGELTPLACVRESAGGGVRVEAGRGEPEQVG